MTSNRSPLQFARFSKRPGWPAKWVKIPAAQSLQRLGMPAVADILEQNYRRAIDSRAAVH